MKRSLMYLMVLLALLAACAPTEEPPTPMEEPPAPVEEPPTPAPVLPFTLESIGPGQQQAYSFLSSSGEEIIYLLYLPENYDEGQTWPLILSLHGGLGSNGDLERVRNSNLLTWVDPAVEFPFIVISPFVPNHGWEIYHEPMDELFEFLGESLSINSDALFLTGLSLGATAAWQWALANPDRFAGMAVTGGALSAIRSAPAPENICLLTDLPIWVAHSEADIISSIDSDIVAVTALEACGSAVVHFTTYTDLRHMESIRTAYAGPELYEWMLELTE